ncbi:MAG TPA: response regulator [Anaerolineae bacterium]
MEKLTQAADYIKRRILLIDDDPLIRQLVNRALSDATLQVDEASSGLDGIAQALAHPPDLILLDVMMPGMDGYEVCNRLRQQSSTVNVPIIILTALDQIDSKIIGLRTGADDYMTKPFDMRELRMRVEAHLRRSIRDLTASPLTGLPGNPLIEQVIATRLQAHEKLAVIYADLSNFKAYNDVYGWLKGDQVIKLLANTLIEAVTKFGTKTDFIGHVGGDDFVAISIPDCAASIAQEVIDRFDAAVPGFYDDEARANGYTVVRDRTGKIIHASFVAVSIAIVTNARRDLDHPLQVATLAAEVKQHIKARPGSHFGFDRRIK